jgi:hypothetical protein
VTILMRAITAGAMLGAASLGAASLGAAWAGGDEYDAAKDVEQLGPAYFGFVRDPGGTPLPDAEVTLTPKSGEAVTIKTNILGLYRSHVRKGVSPDDVSVSCEKTGYRSVQVYRRTPPGSKDMFIETDCTLRKS